jgi:hypothetical protein
MYRIGQISLARRTSFLRLMADGMSTRQIAEELKIGEQVGSGPHPKDPPKAGTRSGHRRAPRSG